MPNWKQILNEIKATGSQHDVVRRKYLKKLSQCTKRNVIAYYSGWLQKASVAAFGSAEFGLTDADKNGFMTCVNKLDRRRGLDLLLHTPGGEAAATESLVYYLRAMFDTDIRVIVPQIALSAGTMIACAFKEVIMGEHSSLGPIDPQYMGVPAHGILEEFEQAAREIREDSAKIPLWQPIIGQYRPTLIGECQKVIEWSTQMVREWLISGMFKGDPQAAQKAEDIVSELADHALTLSHARHISLDHARKLGLNISPLEADDDLQEAVLSLHHAYIHTFQHTAAFKIIENNLASAFILSLRQSS